MKTSYNWLKKYVPIPWEPQQLANELTMAGLEVEEIRKINDFPRTLVTAKILSRIKHPNADKLSVCVVDDSSGEAVQVICGAANCNAGENVVLAKVGTVFPGGDSIKKVKIRGEYSYGMLCSEKELELGSDHTGILLLPMDTPLGIPLSDYLETDTVIDWEVTPNRPDWLSHIGIAREIAVLAKSSLKLPTIQLKEEEGTNIDDSVSVEVHDQNLCPCYTARIIKDVRIGPSPQWIQTVLNAVGLRPINNVVDITNFVLLECGQPLHAFDLNKLAGRKIMVRRALKAEKLPTLDHRIQLLNSDHLVIADADRSIALAGIIGGDNSEITDKTTDVLLESAMFDPNTVRKTAKQLDISTDSSFRFERGVDIEMVRFASARAAQLISEYAGGKVVKGTIDIRADAPRKPNQILLRCERVNQLIGLPIEPDFVESTFQRLGLSVIKKDEKKWMVSIPSFRMDLTREVDLVEEVARCYGLDRIPVAKHQIRIDENIADDAYQPVQLIRNQLVELGLQECLTYSFVSEKDTQMDENKERDHAVPLMNPLSFDRSTLRQNLLAGMIQSIAHNVAHGNTDLRLFEIGRVFSQNSGTSAEHHEVSIALTGRKHPERYSGERGEVFDFYDLRGLLEDWMESRKVGRYRVRKTSHPAFEAGNCAEIIQDNTNLGVMGKLGAAFLAQIRIKNPVYVSLIHLDKLLDCASGSRLFKPLPLFPPTTRDVAFAAEEDLEHQLVVDTIRDVGITFLESIELVDVFHDDTLIGKDRKSMAYTLTFRSPEKTLSDKEVNEAQEKIRLSLIDKLPIQIR